MKYWFWERFLPVWAKETLLRDNRQLRRELRRLEQVLEQKNAYIKGLEDGNRTCRWVARVMIAGGKK